jgi:phosphatidylglycerophosphate synthase
MLDRPVRRLLAPALDALARRLEGSGLHPNAVTLAGLAVGLLAIPLLAAQLWLAALAAILLSRLADGLDGALARRVGVSDLGGYLDIVCDFVFYAGVAFGFALARPDFAVPAAFLTFAFVGTGSSFLAYAIVAAKRGIVEPAPQRRSIYYLGGLTEGTETIAAFVAFCLFPRSFPLLAYVFGGLCWVTTATRVAMAWRAFRG